MRFGHDCKVDTERFRHQQWDNAEDSYVVNFMNFMKHEFYVF